MDDYLSWLNKCQSGDFTFRVNFKHELRKERSITDGKVALEDALHLCTRLSKTGWTMTFDGYPYQIIKLEIDAIRKRAILTVIRNIDGTRQDQVNEVS
ncbi:MAG: hypothetical protein KAX55_10630 [Propionivibrio sp.]|nr:hypothetical protein [Propionivibrio sp.]